MMVDGAIELLVLMCKYKVLITNLGLVCCSHLKDSCCDIIVNNFNKVSSHSIICIISSFSFIQTVAICCLSYIHTVRISNCQ